MPATASERSLQHTLNKNDEFSIFKTDDDKRLVFGWASIAITVDGEQLEDRQKDIIDPEDLEEAAYEYVLNFRDTGEEHIKSMRKKGKLVESCVFTEEKQQAIGIPPGIIPVGWWIGFRIEDDSAWEKVKNGTYRMFSIEGKATRIPVGKAEPNYNEFPSYDMWLEENLDATIEEQRNAKEHYAGLKKADTPTGCGVLVTQGGKVLAGTRMDARTRGQIGGPGGNIEPGEDPEQAAKREAYEEFGIHCESLKPLGTIGNGKSAVFLCTKFSGTPTTDDIEMSNPQWLSPSEIEEDGAFLPFYQSLNLLPKNVAKTFDEILKFNPYHDARGRFASANSYATFTYKPGKSKAHDLAIQRQQQRFQGGAGSVFQGPARPQNMPPKPKTPPKPTKNFDRLGFADYDDADFHQLHSGRKYYQQQKLTASQQRGVTNYLEAVPEPGSLYSHSQNMNHKMVNGQKLTGKYKQTHDELMSSMHNIGYNVNLTRYDHPGMINGMLKAVGAGSDYEHMSASAIKKALVGQSVGENKFLSCSYNDFSGAPASSKQVFNSRAVKINYKVSAKTQAMMPGNGPGGNLGEIILAPTNGKSNNPGKITDVRLTGQMVRRKGTQTYNQPRIEIDIEI